MAASKEPRFEEALERLEKIVGEMESGDLALEDILRKYEEGNHLVKLCAARLNEAEKRIEILMKEKDGSLGVAPLSLDGKTEDADQPQEKPRRGRAAAPVATTKDEDLF